MSEGTKSLLPGATRRLAEFSSSLRFGDLPAEAVERIKRSILDSVGCCLHGVTLPWTRKVQALVLGEGGKPVASIYGAGGRTSVSNAVLVNSTAGHAFELDDIHKESIIHPGSIALPVATAFAEARKGTTGADLITAMAAGYEVGARVGCAATMRLFFRGFHPQGTSGVFCAAATAARMLQLGPDQTQHAFGIVGSQAGGLMAAQEGAMVKRFHSGRAAQSGAYAALLARDGFTGITDVLEAGYGGYLSSYSDQPNAARLLDGLGVTWEILNVGYKPHAAVTSIHTALDGLAEIMKENGLSADAIESVSVGLSKMTHVHCAWEYKAQGVTAAQMNLYYGLAVIALDGAAFVDQYREDRLADPAILSFMRKVRAHIDPIIESMGPAFRHASRVDVVTRDGRTFHKQTLQRRGSAENPIGQDDIERKFKSVTAGVLSKAKADAIVRIVQGMERQQDLGEFLGMLAGGRSQLA